MNPTAKIDSKRNVLIIEIPLQPPTPSKSSGKTMVVASTRGFVATDAKIDGKNVSISVNAFIK